MKLLVFENGGVVPVVFHSPILYNVTLPDYKLHHCSHRLVTVYDHSVQYFFITFVVPMTSHLFLLLSAGHFHWTEDECDCTSRLWQLVAVKNAACFPLGSESASALYFYDCLKQGLKLGCRSSNEAPGRLPLIQSKLTPSLPSTHSVLVFF